MSTIFTLFLNCPLKQTPSPHFGRSPLSLGIRPSSAVTTSARSAVPWAATGPTLRRRGTPTLDLVPLATPCQNGPRSRAWREVLPFSSATQASKWSISSCRRSAICLHSTHSRGSVSGVRGGKLVFLGGSVMSLPILYEYSYINCSARVARYID